MGFWYLLAVVIGVFLYVKFTFFNKQLSWKSVLSVQLSVIGIGLVIFAIFMLLPVSTRLIDLLFS